MITDDIATITPGAGDDEERFLGAATEALTVFCYYLARAARARGIRTVTSEDLELAQDEALEMQRGIDRAILRRRRDLNVGAKRIAGGAR